MDAHVMTLRCDHCRRPLGALVRHYWHMRFCSAVCMQAYQGRLADVTKEKIAKLPTVDADVGRARRMGGRLFGSRMAEPSRRLAG
jgi:hypothetical protein